MCSELDVDAPSLDVNVTHSRTQEETSAQSVARSSTREPWHFERTAITCVHVRRGAADADATL